MDILDAQGAIITISDGEATPAQVPIGGVISFTGFDGEASERDVTTLASTAMEYRLGLQDFGSFTMQMHRNPSDPGQAELETIKASRAVREMTLELESGHIATFDVLCRSLTAAGGVNDNFDGQSTLRITGEVTWTMPA